MNINKGMVSMFEICEFDMFYCNGIIINNFKDWMRKNSTLPIIK